jgi:hypothetical protein
MDTLSLLRAGKLAGSRRLDLSCGLTEFPVEIFDLADSLEILNLSGNALSLLPPDLDRLHRLRIVFCSDNQFVELPEVLGRCQQLEMIGFKANRIRTVAAAALPARLRWLILTDNQLDALPAELGLCTRLQKLMLAGNRLQQLPEQMAACTSLELLRIAANRFEALPPWLLTLPRLAWLAYAGNPFCDRNELALLARPQNDQLRRIGWHSLSMRQQLGEGASGVIYQACWQQQNDGKEVAVKLFKGAVTSDGLPHSEMAACISAGQHPNLIGVEGKICGHPDSSEGLVMALIDPDFANLAGPPSLESCSRDVYPDGSSFTLDSALRIAHGIAAATSHLHAQGILHGDLYGHNILHNGDGDCLLGDFGAASFLPTDDPLQAEALQRIEVRAFACLLEELLERCTAPAAMQELLQKLWELQARCADGSANARPLFAEIEQNLAAWRQDCTGLFVKSCTTAIGSSPACATTE